MSNRKKILDKINFFFLLISKNYKLYILSLILFSITVKILLLFTYDITQSPDARKYINIIEYYREKFVFDTPLELSLRLILSSPYMKIYPTIIYMLGAKFVQIIQILTSSICIFLVFEICKLITKNLFVSCISASLLVLNPFITYYSLILQYETLFIFFLLLGIYLFLNNYRIYSFLIFILTIFINPVIEIGITLFILLTYYLYFKHSLKKSFSNLIIFLCLYSIFQFLNIYNNYKIFGTYERFYNHAAAAYEYNEVYEKYGLDHQRIDDLHKKLVKRKCDLNLENKKDLYYRLTYHRLCVNKILNKHAYDYITNSDNLIPIFKNFLTRIGRLFSLYPYDTKETHVKIISITYYSFLYFFLIIFFLKKKYIFNKNFYPIIVLTLLSLLVYILLHAVFRYRVSYDPFLIILASNVINDFIRKIIKN